MLLVALLFTILVIYIYIYKRGQSQKKKGKRGATQEVTHPNYTYKTLSFIMDSINQHSTVQ